MNADRGAEGMLERLALLAHLLRMPQRIFVLAMAFTAARASATNRPPWLNQATAPNQTFQYP
jgi:hypothetical protein